MLVKAIRKGFHNRVRHACDTFTFKGKCPSWCIEVAAGKSKTMSEGLKAVDAVTVIGTMRDVDEIRDFVNTDKRTSVIEAAMNQITEIEQ